MCTVTYIPTLNGFILTSSRDEQVIRPTLVPELYEVKGEKIVFPKDKIAGGTWIASNLSERKACLLNGAFANHIKKANHTKSRGLILLESFHYDSAQEFAKLIDLQNVEPFTLLLFEGNVKPEINALIWDGQIKHFSKIKNTDPLIWSSTALYDKKQRAMRETWFLNWIKNNKEHSDYQILNFYLHKHTKDEENNILMKRSNYIQTVSISQIRCSEKSNEFVYYDLINQEQSSLDLKNLTE